MATQTSTRSDRTSPGFNLAASKIRWDSFLLPNVLGRQLQRLLGRRARYSLTRIKFSTSHTDTRMQ